MKRGKRKGKLKSEMSLEQYTAFLDKRARKIQKLLLDDEAAFILVVFDNEEDGVITTNGGPAIFYKTNRILKAAVKDLLRSVIEKN